ncbi:MAG: hypothetical protein N3G76_01000 [Candidatus Micrarchaeota archaeon]|nr:hypothetical protein [Candidatus Micrarchaeota archaeon]
MGVKKSLRTVFRYIKLELLTSRPEFASGLEERLRAHLQKMLGQLSAPKIKLIPLNSDSENTYLLRCDSASFMRVRQALLFFYDKDYRLKLHKSSGTIKSLNEPELD